VDRAQVGGPVVLVELAEPLQVARLLGKVPHHADPRQALLQVRGDRRHLLARGAVGVGRHDPERERRERQHREHEEREQRQLEVEDHEDRRRADERQGRAEQRHHAVGDQLVERLHVVGQPRDQHARLPARVEAHRQRLQVREQLDPQVLQHTLADPADEVRLCIGRAPVDDRAREERDHHEREHRQVAGRDPLVDRQLRQRRRGERRARADRQRSEHQQRARPVRPQEEQQPPKLARAAAGDAPAARDLGAPGRGRAGAVRARQPHSAATASCGVLSRNA
jgi:hypothetical protein